MITSEINISGEQDLVDACFSSLCPDKEFKSGRAEYDLNKRGGKLRISIKARDLSAFRAVTVSITNTLGIVNTNWKKK